ncbi:hypothetical protein [Sorangium atrum]|uniref:Uncharacterized protein n=1 Tax=Sorangium atrum TaxID=2995308 RepID=A0ABT5CEB1_9BACT|nr:hypothetical protein [Sorangium aterium]MDC0684781.1 hypothetical protein [Sorangium aterium]MDC0685533.1 hypothetical protein [Sorangium aterium]
MMLAGHLDDPLEDALLARAGWARDAEVEAHLGASGDCARRLAHAEAAVAAVALALPPVPPKGRLRARLFASVDRRERFTRWRRASPPSSTSRRTTPGAPSTRCPSRRR